MDDRTACAICGERHGGAPGHCQREAAAQPAKAAEGTVRVDPMVGQTVGEYVISGTIGYGGMGIVYRGEQPVIGKPVAIKVLRPQVARDPDQMRRLLDEARSVNAIRHRGIIDIFSFGTLPDRRQYLVMELLEGEPLNKVIEQQAPLPVVEVLGVLDEVLDALSAAHGTGVIHRDLKPSNIFLVSPPHGNRYVKLLDFGLAKQAGTPHGETPQTRVTMAVGTPQYMAPEQVRGDKVSPRTDLYAAGVVAFELLTGRLPFESDDPLGLMNKHLSEPPPRPSSVAPAVPEDVDDLVLRLLQKDPNDRPASAEVVRREIGRIRRAMQSGETRLIEGATDASDRPTASMPSLSPLDVRDARLPPPRARRRARERLTEAIANTRRSLVDSARRLRPPKALGWALAVAVAGVAGLYAGARLRGGAAVAAGTDPTMPLPAVGPVTATPASTPERSKPGGSLSPPVPPSTSSPLPTARVPAIPAARAEQPASPMPSDLKADPSAENPDGRAMERPTTAEPNAHAVPESRTARTETSAVAAKPPPSKTAKTTQSADVDALRTRLSRVRVAWHALRRTRPPADVRLFDAMLAEIERKVARGDREQLAEARRNLDDFEQSALAGENP